MGCPPSDLEDYRQWQQRLQRYQTTEMNLDVFCLQEGVSRSTFYRWKQRLDEDLVATSRSRPRRTPLSTNGPRRTSRCSCPSR